MQFEHPGWLVLLALLVPVVWWSRAARRTLGPIRGVVVPGLRCLLVISMVCALASPAWTRSSDRMTVAVILDRSQSIDHAQAAEAEAWVRKAVTDRGEYDLLAVVSTARAPEAVLMPDAHATVPVVSLQGSADGTDLASAIDFAKGLLPRDGVYRILLVSDGVETSGSVMAAAESAGAIGLPIDVLPLEYQRTGEIMVERVVAPRAVRSGEDVPVQVVLRSEGPTTGQLVVRRDGVRLGAPMALDLKDGVTVVDVLSPGVGGGVQRFEAIVTTDQPGDRLANNVASAITMTEGGQRVLVAASAPAAAESLAELLRSRGLEVTSGSAAALAGGLSTLTAYDAIVMIDVPRWSLPDRVDGELAAWVRDGGGGLLMIGGPTAFGAGGWIGSEVASVLPVDIDPPSDRLIRRGALALVLHSCEMPSGNYWGRRVAEASIEALSQKDYVGILEFNQRSGREEWSLPMQEAGDKRAAMAAAANLKYGDMPSFAPALLMAYEGLKELDVGARHIVVISDGDPQPPSPTLLKQCREAGVSITTIMVGGHGTPIDRRRMETIARATGGRFHNVTDANRLPQLFIEESRVVSRSLFHNGRAAATWATAAGGPLPEAVVASLGQLPEVRGYSVVAERGGLAVVAATITDERDTAQPLCAWAFQGNGRVVAFTGSFTYDETPAWAAWNGRGPLWRSIARWILRPADDGTVSMQLNATSDGSVDVTLEVEAKASDLRQAVIGGVAIGPKGVTRPIDLRQIGPGRYAGTFEMDDAGGWIVAARYAGEDAQTGEAREGWVHGAVVRPWSAEEGVVQSNGAVLREVASRSGGRVFELANDPVEADLFDRQGLVPKSSTRGIWMLLAALAALVLIADVAVRRIVPDRDRAQTLARRAAHAGEGARRETTAAWKRIRARASMTSRTDRPAPSAPPVHRPPSPDVSVRDAGETDADGEHASEDTMSRLRAARKRRQEGGRDG